MSAALIAAEKEMSQHKYIDMDKIFMRKGFKSVF